MTCFYGGKSMTRRFRKKPVEVEAMLWPVITIMSPHISELAQPIHDWIGTATKFEDYWNAGKLWGRIRTLEDTTESLHYVSPGDWIIKGVHGEFYACKPDIFEETYEEVTDAG